MMSRTKVAHEPVIQRPIRGQVSIGRRDPCDDEVFKSRICAQADGQADGFAHALVVKGSRLDFALWCASRQYTPGRGLQQA